MSKHKYDRKPNKKGHNVSWEKPPLAKDDTKKTNPTAAVVAPLLDRAALCTMIEAEKRQLKDPMQLFARNSRVKHVILNSMSASSFFQDPTSYNSIDNIVKELKRFYAHESIHQLHRMLQEVGYSPEQATSVVVMFPVHCFKQFFAGFQNPFKKGDNIMRIKIAHKAKTSDLSRFVIQLIEHGHQVAPPQPTSKMPATHEKSSNAKKTHARTKPSLPKDTQQKKSKSASTKKISPAKKNSIALASGSTKRTREASSADARVTSKPTPSADVAGRKQRKPSKISILCCGSNNLADSSDEEPTPRATKSLKEMITEEKAAAEKTLFMFRRESPARHFIKERLGPKPIFKTPATYSTDQAIIDEFLQFAKQPVMQEVYQILLEVNCSEADAVKLILYFGNYCFEESFTTSNNPSQSPLNDIVNISRVYRTNFANLERQVQSFMHSLCPAITLSTLNAVTSTTNVVSPTTTDDAKNTTPSATVLPSKAPTTQPATKSGGATSTLTFKPSGKPAPRRTRPAAPKAAATSVVPKPATKPVHLKPGITQSPPRTPAATYASPKPSTTPAPQRLTPAATTTTSPKPSTTPAPRRTTPAVPKHGASATPTSAARATVVNSTTDATASVLPASSCSTREVMKTAIAKQKEQAGAEDIFNTTSPVMPKVKERLRDFSFFTAPAESYQQDHNKIATEIERFYELPFMQEIYDTLQEIGYSKELRLKLASELPGHYAAYLSVKGVTNLGSLLLDIYSVIDQKVNDVEAILQGNQHATLSEQSHTKAATPSTTATSGTGMQTSQNTRLAAPQKNRVMPKRKHQPKAVRPTHVKATATTATPTPAISTLIVAKSSASPQAQAAALAQACAAKVSARTQALSQVRAGTYATPKAADALPATASTSKPLPATPKAGAPSLTAARADTPIKAVSKASDPKPTSSVAATLKARAPLHANNSHASTLMDAKAWTKPVVKSGARAPTRQATPAKPSSAPAPSSNADPIATFWLEKARATKAPRRSVDATELTNLSNQGLVTGKRAIFQAKEQSSTCRAEARKIHYKP